MLAAEAGHQGRAVWTPGSDESHQILLRHTFGAGPVPRRVIGAVYELHTPRAAFQELGHVVSFGGHHKIPTALLRQVVGCRVVGIADIVRAVVHPDGRGHLKETSLVQMDRLESKQHVGTEFLGNVFDLPVRRFLQPRRTAAHRLRIHPRR
ncbi:Uncharacterised protein [Mycobacteroides abscessus subsp. abscessus]|nr:Uncharacterised protein [Mycobacteroides abscessus subsp. abscessus]